MEFGASIFFTDYSITPADLGVALEQRGFDSLWAAEHSHIPVPRRTPPPGGGELAKRYYDVMDPFVTLTAAAAATKTLKVGTGVCLVIQRDTIQTAKLVASIDQVSGGRFLFGIGGGWNAEEIEAHGTVFATRMKKMREQIEAMKEIWTKDTAEYNGDIVRCRRCRRGRSRCRSRTRRCCLAAHSHGQRGARCAMAMAGTRTPAAAIPRITCHGSARWPPKPVAIRIR
jgi:probable F420-dependent oxidoreductase